MLSDSKLTDYSYIVAARFEAINTHYIKLMAKQIKEIGKLSPSNLYRLQQMTKMQQNIDTINYLLAQETGRTLEELYQIYDMSGMSLYEDTYNLYTARGIAQVPFEQNTRIQQYLESMKQLTANTFVNLSNTTALYEPYRHLVDTAIDAIVSGTGSYDELIRAQLTDTSLSPLVRNADEGLRITYASGQTRRLDSAIRMNVLDGMREVNNGIREQVGKEFGADGVEVTVHALCAADHIDIQGRQFSKEEFARVNGALRRKISTCNCKHATFPIILGVSEPAYTDDELAKYKANSEQTVTIDGREMTKYEATQVQRKVETEIRKAKDRTIFAENSGDVQLAKQAKARVEALKKHYNNVSRQAGLTPKMDRTYVQGYTGKQVKPKSIKLSI
uniref:Minor capsid protein n=1 Tax=Siphoviridae sp. ctwDi18 TaxID=2827970 RepID=A0A8S5T9C5_9CAUD|nr:MAG TPA: minor capsid protein [Siphoviridae sp. ctwDi18]